MISIQIISYTLCYLTQFLWVWNLGGTLTLMRVQSRRWLPAQRLHRAIGCTSKRFLLVPDTLVLATGRGLAFLPACTSPQSRWRACREDGGVGGPRPTDRTRYPSHPSHSAVQVSLQHGSWLRCSRCMQGGSHVFMTSPNTIISVTPYGLQRSAPHSVGDYTRV